MQFKSGVLIIALLGLSALAFTLYNNPEQDLYSPSQLSQNDWKIEQVQSWQLNANGVQHYLEAKNLRQQDDTVFVTLPYLVRDTLDQRMIIKSAQAQIEQQTLFEFKGKVQVEHFLTNQNTPRNVNLLNTEQLKYNKNTETLSSPVAVTLKSKNTHTQGIGLTLDLETQHTRLHSQVKTTHYDIN